MRIKNTSEYIFIFRLLFKDKRILYEVGVGKYIIKFDPYPGILWSKSYGIYIFNKQATMCWGEKRLTWYLPTAIWKLTKFSLYDISGGLFYSNDTPGKISRVKADFAACNAVSKISFKLCEKGKLKEVTTYIEELEYVIPGFMSHIVKGHTEKNLVVLVYNDILFKFEGAKDYAPYKIKMRQGELHVDAFRRYCLENIIVTGVANES
jgi:hypothetical protein